MDNTGLTLYATFPESIGWSPDEDHSITGLMNSDDNEAMEDPVKDTDNQHIQTTIVQNSKPVEIEPGKVLNINANLDSEQ